MHQAEGEAKPVYVNLKDPTDVFEIGMNRAVELLAEKRANRRRLALYSLMVLLAYPRRRISSIIRWIPLMKHSGTLP